MSDSQADEREKLTELLDPDEHSDATRRRALDDLDVRDLLPVRDPVDGQFITEVDVDHGPPGESGYVKLISKIIDGDCPECGYDRVDELHWQIYTCEHGWAKQCRACGYEIDFDSTL